MESAKDLNNSYTSELYEMISCKTKQWGNSIGIIIPSEIIREMNIKPNEEIVVDIEKKKSVLKELFGSIKFKKPPSQAVKDFRKEMESKLDVLP